MDAQEMRDAIKEACPSAQDIQLRAPGYLYRGEVCFETSGHSDIDFKVLEEFLDISEVEVEIVGAGYDYVDERVVYTLPFS